MFTATTVTTTTVTATMVLPQLLLHQSLFSFLVNSWQGSVETIIVLV